MCFVFRWSAIAARLPGRTDNEIKNVWHTHLKKKLKDYQPPQNAKKHRSVTAAAAVNAAAATSSTTTSEDGSSSVTTVAASSPQRSSSSSSSSEMSSVTDMTDSSAATGGVAVEDAAAAAGVKQEDVNSSLEYFPEIDESFWTEDAAMVESFPDWVQVDEGLPAADVDMMMWHSKTDEDDMDFWYNVFVRSAGELPELSQF